MRQTLLTTLAILFCVVSSFSHPPTAWNVINHPNGFSIQLPSSFSSGLLVGDGTLQWFANSIDEEIEVTVETVSNGAPGKLDEEFTTDQPVFTKVSYKVLKPTWYIISGESRQGISHTKTIMKDGVLHRLWITYPAAQQSTMDAWVPQIMSSFKVSSDDARR